MFRQAQATEEQEFARSNAMNTANSFNDIFGNHHSGRMVLIAAIASRLDLLEYRNAARFNFPSMELESVQNFKD